MDDILHKPQGQRARGQTVEAAACHYLQQQGLILLDSNYTLRSGELDLVMQQGDTIVFVEVRYRRTDRYGTPAETVTRSKQRKLLLAARHWLATHPRHAQQPCRVDIMAARPGESGLQFEWITNALGP
jgi:putative endonuclease